MSANKTVSQKQTVEMEQTDETGLSSDAVTLVPDQGKEQINT